VDAVTGETRTFSDILTRSLSVAECLRVQGVAVGDVVAICSENSLDFIVPVLATYYIGAICAPLNPNYTTRKCQWIYVCIYNMS
jgi:acyl-CoA synthetase (AMP-forming)/AMP-acid ligase II